VGGLGNREPAALMPVHGVNKFVGQYCDEKYRLCARPFGQGSCC
jgi:hypothetical protein